MLGAAAAAAQGVPPRPPQQDLPWSVPSALRPDEPFSRTAVCLVGELRSIALTGPGLRRHLIDELQADAFVVGITHGPAAKEDHDLLRALGPRLVHTALGPDAELIDTDPLLPSLLAAPNMRSMYLNLANNGGNNWTSKIAHQWLNRKVCPRPQAVVGCGAQSPTSYSEASVHACEPCACAAGLSGRGAAV